MSAGDGLLAAVRELHAEHWSQAAIARELGVSRSSVYDWLRGAYEPKEDTGRAALAFYRDNVGEDTSKTFSSGTRYETLYMPRSFDIATDLAYWQSQHPNADSFHVSVRDPGGGWGSTHSLPARDTNAIVEETGAMKAKYYRHKQGQDSDIDGVEFVAVYL